MASQLGVLAFGIFEVNQWRVTAQLNANLWNSWQIIATQFGGALQATMHR